MISLIVTVCLANSPLNCMTLSVPTQSSTVEACNVDAQQILARTSLDHPDWRFPLFHCEKEHAPEKET